MRIEGTGTGSGAFPMGGTQKMDAQSKQIQNQIENTKKELEKLSQNSDLSVEEKIKKRQELNAKISELQGELRAHQQEVRMKEQQEQAAEANRNAENRSQAKEEPAATVGISKAGMKALLAAGSSMKLADVQGSVAATMEGRAGVLESEISMDAARGSSVEKKKEELADIEQKAVKATSAQIGTLGDALEAAEQAKNEEDEQKVQPKNEKDGLEAQARSSEEELETQARSSAEESEA